MRSPFRQNFAARISLSFGLLVVLICVLFVAGGSSRHDVAGQAVSRGVAWLSFVIMLLAGVQIGFERIKLPAILLGLMVALPLFQLAPLPVSLWQSLPGRTIFAEAAIVSGQPQPWRPWSIVPGMTLNAAASLLVPATVLLLLAGLRDRERSWLPALLFGLVVAAMLIGLLQLSGATFDNPFINDGPGEVGGIFANRNHFALFLAFGCLFAPTWAFSGDSRASWRGPVALSAALLFVLTILATGSRTGILLGSIATAHGLLIARREIRRELRGRPRWVTHATIAAIVALFAFLIVISVAANRAESVNRLLAISAATDTRFAALPTVIAMIKAYFPFGTGFGSFDPLFRLHEPNSMLSANYFNHAHNDFLEVILDGGLPATLILVVTLGWYCFATFRAWRVGSNAEHALSQSGSAMIFLVLVASILDYPARTPMIMAMLAVGSFWLNEARLFRSSAPLPASDQPL